MTLVTLLLLTVAAGDLARERFRRPAGPIIGALVAIAVALLSAWGLGVGVGWAIGAAAVALLWIGASTTIRTDQWGYLILAILALPLAAAWAWAPLDISPDSGVALWYNGLPHGITDTTDASTFALVVAATLALLETSNIVVRTIIAAAPRHATPDTPAAVSPGTPRRRPLFSFPRAKTEESADVGPHASATPIEPPLKGGRIIGPFERLFLFALVLAGQFTAIAALVAAKGIIRFPEISRDEPHGTKAEYFLVGSFASWATVAIMAVLLLTA